MHVLLLKQGSGSDHFKIDNKQNIILVFNSKELNKTAILLTASETWCVDGHGLIRNQLRKKNEIAITATVEN